MKGTDFRVYPFLAYNQRNDIGNSAELRNI